MAIKIISRNFDPHHAAEIVTLENSLGVRHVLTVHIAGHESCPSCGHLLNTVRGEADVEGVVKRAIAEFAAHEKKLLAHARKRKR